MAIHVQDEETDWLVREFARRRGLGLTAAIKTAVREASQREGAEVEDFLARIKPIQERARVRKPADVTGGRPVVDEKRFMDEMWGEE